MDKAEAATLLGARAENMAAFEYVDPFNTGNTMTGFLCREPNKRYGALVIDTINGLTCPQVVWATPKLKYPFDRQGTFRFPPVKRIEVYEKLDGTNVLAYRYQDAAGAWFTTYKLRLSPFIGNTRWGNFQDMWWEMLDAYPDIPKLPEKNGCSIGFELYGSRNEHLIRYPEDLEIAMLYGIRSNGEVVSPSALDRCGTTIIVAGAHIVVTVPVAEQLGCIPASMDPVKAYRQIQTQAENRNKTLEDGKISGTEGSVWYVHDITGTVHLMKCKPASVEAIHWASGHTLNKVSITATCQNCLETSDVLSWDTLLPLLREEYEMPQIDEQRELIEFCIAKVNAEIAMREHIFEVYQQEQLDLRADRGGTMRALSKHFRPQDMKRVFNFLDTHLKAQERRGGSSSSLESEENCKNLLTGERS